jgi:pantoate--beta-alanine ligase
VLTAHSIDEVRAAVAHLPRPLGLVPTMGALHAGHLALVRAARAGCASVAASIFVNPIQFGPGEDLEKDPRDEHRDVKLLADAGVDVCFLPTTEEMYPPGAATRVHVGGSLTAAFEAACRPGHFDGVATVVLKLLHILVPDRLYLGEKDAQQLAVVRRMVRDLDLQVEVTGVPTVREPDGLAMSSRTAYLSAAQRTAAPRLYQALRAAPEVARDGSSAALADAVSAALAPPADAPRELAFQLEYVAVVDRDSFEPVAAPRPGDLLVAAARLGEVRLLDNIRLGDEVRAGGRRPVPPTESEASTHG